MYQPWAKTMRRKKRRRSVIVKAQRWGT